MTDGLVSENSTYQLLEVISAPCVSWPPPKRCRVSWIRPRPNGLVTPRCSSDSLVKKNHQVQADSSRSECKVPYRKRKNRLTGIEVQVGAMRPIAPNVIWAMDFQFDLTSDLRTITMLNIIDEFTRECLAIDVTRSITADDVVNRLEELMKERGAPHFLRIDNGPEFVAQALQRLVALEQGAGVSLHSSGFTLAERMDQIVQRLSSRRVP